MYFDIYHIANIVFYILLGISGLLLIYKIIFHIVGLFPAKRFKEAKQNHRYAILIPARNESKVIEEILKSIQNQTYPKELLDTYVIVEREDDPTCEIAKVYENVKVFVRKHLERKGKGYALDEAVKDILERGESYEAYFIFDADNVLYPTFIEEMNKAYDAGYELALGYRNSKNWNGGWIASNSALTFSMVNTFQNKCRSRFNMNVIVSGTGFYIAGSVLEKLGGWPFNTLTEDYEISCFATLNNLKSTYNEYAEYYDEQPTKLKVSWNQRLRWVKGHNQVDKLYSKKLRKSLLVDSENRLSKLEFSVSIFPVMFLLLTLILYMLFQLGLGIAGLCLGETIAYLPFRAFGWTLLATYLFYVCYAGVMLLAERKHININAKNVIACIFTAPIYWAMYIPIYITSVFKKEVKWVPIEHSVTLDANSFIITKEEKNEKEDKKQD